MSGVSSADGGSFLGSDVRLSAQDSAAGQVSFGGVSISAADAAEFVMMHRTEVLKQVGADRTQMAEKHLDDIRRARQYYTDLNDLKKFAGGDDIYHGRAPMTPDMVDFLENDVGCSSHTKLNRVIFPKDAYNNLPQSVQEYYKDKRDPDGHKYQIHGVPEIYKDNIGEVKENVDNYIDQMNDSNNLFMTKFKNVLNTMNEALDGANSVADKSSDTLKNLVSRW